MQKMDGVVAFLNANTIKTGNLFVFAKGGFDSENDEEVYKTRLIKTLEL